MPRRLPLLPPFLLAVLLAGCGGTPPAPTPSLDAMPGTKRHSQTFEGVYQLDYEVDRRYSSIDGVSCYAFITGTLSNRSTQILSRRTTVSFKVYHGSEELFRDFTYLRANLAPGGTIQFELVESPLHKKQCPSYDRIETSLNLVVLRSQAVQ